MREFECNIDNCQFRTVRIDEMQSHYRDEHPTYVAQFETRQSSLDMHDVELWGTPDE